MHASTRNLLYERVELYELIYPELDEATPRMCLRMFDRYLGKNPGSLLDIACGTGRDLNVLSRTIPDCWGFDLLPQAIAYAQSRRPHLQLKVGDMRTMRLGRTFEALTCFGSALTYALANEDIDAALRTMAIHADQGALLLLDLTNAAAFLAGGSFQPARTFHVDAAGFKARAEVSNTFDRGNQQIIRRRIWHIEGQERPVEDFCRYRLFFPEELRHRLKEHGFSVLGLYDNKELHDSDFTGSTLYVAAGFEN